PSKAHQRPKASAMETAMNVKRNSGRTGFKNAANISVPVGSSKQVDKRGVIGSRNIDALCLCANSFRRRQCFGQGDCGNTAYSPLVDDLLPRDNLFNNRCRASKCWEILADDI